MTYDVGPDHGHVRHCMALNENLGAVCNRDYGHDGHHESRSDHGRGCIGWRRRDDEQYAPDVPPSEEVLRHLRRGWITR